MHYLANKIKIILPLLMVVSVFWLYSPVLKHDLVWDDVNYLKTDKVHMQPDYVSKALTTPFYISNSYYRPLPTLFIYSEARLNDTQPLPLHRTNLIMHIINVLLVYFLSLSIAQKFTEKNKAAYFISCFSALIFGLHPAALEPAAWISGRFDLMLTMFSLGLLLIDIKLLDKFPKYILIYILFLLAALSKEMAIGLPLAMPLWHILTQKTHQTEKLDLRVILKIPLQKANLRVYFSIFCAGATYLLIRWYAIGYIIPTTAAEVNFGPQEYNKFLLFTKTVATYLQLIFAPLFNLGPTNHLQLPLQINTWENYLIGILVLCISLTFLRYHSYLKFSVFVLMLVLLLFPVLHIIPFSINEDSFAHSRFILLPLAISASTFPIFAVFIMNYFSRAFSYSISFLIFILFSINILNLKLNIPFWQNDYSFWTWAYTADPKSWTAQQNYAVALSHAGYNQKALTLIEQTLEIKKSASAYILKGILLIKLGEDEQAEETLLKALDFQPTAAEYVEFLTLITKSQINRNKLTDVEMLLKKALALSPKNENIYWRYYDYYKKQGLTEKALDNLDKAIELAEDDNKAILKRIKTQELSGNIND